jgi:hypothetical protein
MNRKEHYELQIHGATICFAASLTKRGRSSTLGQYDILLLLTIREWNGIFGWTLGISGLGHFFFFLLFCFSLICFDFLKSTV